MTKPFFSIIIPARSLSKQIEQDLLPAISGQSFTSFEVYIAIDCKPTSDMLKNKYPWLTLITFPQKSRPGIKRDVCVQKAQGTVLVFIDDDVVPSQTWLENAYSMLMKKPDIGALGGPGILPQHANYWEKVFDAVLTSWIGSGTYTYRFTPQHERFVNDYPSMNLFIRKKVFLKAKGFNSRYWPGEDSKLLNKITHQENGKVYYHPSVLVYHHRRNSMPAYIHQHKKYGAMRGLFAAQGDANSKNIMYALPSFFVLYLGCLGVSSYIVPQMFPTIVSLPLWIYGILLAGFFVITHAQTHSLVIAFGATVIVPITHITYGLWYLVGYIQGRVHKS